jgi:hypothetical protein
MVADSGTFSRHYNAKNGAVIHYEVDWHRYWRTVTWVARVHSPAGLVTSVGSATANIGPADDPVEMVAADVEQNIERLMASPPPDANARPSAHSHKHP